MKRLAPIFLLAAACHGPTLPIDLRHAYDIERTHDDSASLDAWKAIYARCEARLVSGQKARPHDDCGLAAYRVAQMEERLEHFRVARDAYLNVPEMAHEPRTNARAMTRAAEITSERLHDDAFADELAWRTVDAFPDEVPTDDALRLAIKLGIKSDPSALAKRLDGLIARMRKTDLADNLIFERAEIDRTVLNDPAGAIKEYDLLIAEYPHSSLRDEAFMNAAHLERAGGNFQGAIHRLRQLLATRRDALIVGSYNSIYLEQAELEVGQIFLDDLHEPDRAAEAFATLADDFKTSTMRDDGLLELSRAYLARHTPPADADKRDACKALHRLVRDFPDGNMVRRAKEKLGELGCE